MSGRFAALASHLSTPSFGLIAVLFTADYFTGDAIYQCPCDRPLGWRVSYAIIFLLCPIILCLIMDGSSFMVFWSKHPKKKHACCRPLFLSVLWLFVYFSSSRFSECLVPDLPCDCPEPESKVCVEKKKIEPWVQTTAASVMFVLTLITTVFRCHAYKQKSKTVVSSCSCSSCCQKIKAFCSRACSSCCKKSQVFRCCACNSRLNKHHVQFRIYSTQNALLCRECNKNLREEPVFSCCECNSSLNKNHVFDCCACKSPLNESLVRFRITSAQHVFLCCKCKENLKVKTGTPSAASVSGSANDCCACKLRLNKNQVQFQSSSAQNALLCRKCKENLREEPVLRCCACKLLLNESHVRFRITSAQHVFLCFKCKETLTKEPVPSDNWIQELDFGTIQKLHEHRLYNEDSGMSDLCNLSFEDVRRLDIPIGHQLIIIDEIKKRKKPDTPEDIQPEGHGAQANNSSIPADVDSSSEQRSDSGSNSAAGDDITDSNSTDEAIAVQPS